MSADTPLVRRSDTPPVAVLTLDSPANRNALSKRLVVELAAHLGEAAADVGVRAVAVTATGNTFCSGADLTDPPVDSGPGSFPALLEQMWDYPKPLIAAVNGHVRAGGFGLVAVADVVVCSVDATFALTEVRLGLVPAVISVPLLRRMDPLAAHRFFLTGERFSAEQAREAGLVGTLVEPGRLEAELGALAAEFAHCEPEALAATRALMREVPTLGVSEGFARATEVSRRFFSSARAAEGIAAFKGGRRPPWAGGAQPG